MKIHTIVLDDDPHWRTIVGSMVQLNPMLSLVGTCASAMEAYATLTQQEVDLIICDIEMPELSGIEFIKSLRQPPLVIFLTSHRDYAFACYEVAPVDFLLKPLEPGPFLRALEKVRQRLQSHNGEVPMEPYFFIRENQFYTQILCRDVLFMQAQENFLQIVTTTQTYMPVLTIAKMEEILKSDLLIRVHRSYIVNRQAIRQLNRSEIVLLSGDRIPVSEQYRARLERTHLDGRVASRNS